VQVEISLPDENGRLQILQIHTNKMKENSFLAPDVNLQELGKCYVMPSLVLHMYKFTFLDEMKVIKGCLLFLFALAIFYLLGYY